MARSYWLLKSEPDCYPWDQLVRDGSGTWDGVRNHTAKLNLSAMRVGDLGFFYHSNIGKEIVGIVRITRRAYPDPTAPEGSPWVVVDVVPEKSLKRPVTLAEIKADPTLADMALLRQSRLSVGPVTAEEWKYILALSRRAAAPR